MKINMEVFINEYSITVSLQNFIYKYLKLTKLLEIKKRSLSKLVDTISQEKYIRIE